MKTYPLLFCVLLSVNFNTKQLLAQDPTSITLNNYRPKSIYHIPVSHILKARYPVIDMHSHDYAATKQDIDEWVIQYG